MPRKHTCLTVTIVRHGETDQTAPGPRILQGQSDYPMNSRGHKQAAQLAWRLKKEDFDRIYVSDLCRARQTAQDIIKFHPAVPVTVEPRLREQDLGDLTSMLWSDAKAKLREEDVSLDKYLQKTGEPTPLFTERVLSFYADLINTYVVEPHLKASMIAGEPSSPDRVSSPATVYSSASNIGPSSPAVNNPMKAILESKIRAFDDGGESSPLSVITSGMASWSTQVSPNSSVRAAPPSPFPHPPKPRHYHVLIVTHGGVIQTLLRYLLDDLQFPVMTSSQSWINEYVQNNVSHLGFPKTTGVYRFVIDKVDKQRDGDFEWIGSIRLINCVGHLAVVPAREEKEEEERRRLNREIAASAGRIKGEADGAGHWGKEAGLINTGIPRTFVLGNPRGTRKGKKGGIGKKAAEIEMPVPRLRSLGW